MTIGGDECETEFGPVRLEPVIAQVGALQWRNRRGLLSTPSAFGAIPEQAAKTAYDSELSRKHDDLEDDQ